MKYTSILMRFCELCGEDNTTGYIDPTLQRHHIFTRNRCPQLIDDPDNICVCCDNHHRFAESNKKEFEKILIKKRGIEWWNRLIIKAR